MMLYGWLKRKGLESVLNHLLVVLIYLMVSNLGEDGIGVTESISQ